MSTPQLSIIIPTYNRPQLLRRAVKSALAQTIESFEVIVVDDASSAEIDLPEDPRLHLIRLPENRGGAVARNIGAKASQGRWISYLDDDDRLLPHMAEVSLQALAQTSLPSPVAALSGIEVLKEDGTVQQTRLPPTLPKGRHFSLEEISPQQSFLCKQTMVVEKETLLSIGGFDESFTSRVHTELFLRLNPVCSIVGIPIVTYQLIEHQSYRVSRDPSRRQVNFYRLIQKHQDLFQAHPKMFSNFVYDHALTSYRSGQPQMALVNMGRAFKIHPIHTLARLGSPFKRKFLKVIQPTLNK
ncbi:MAG: glycosyltransferase family 2 protein [Microcoleaceae cyanobacterium]